MNTTSNEMRTVLTGSSPASIEFWHLPQNVVVKSSYLHAAKVKTRGEYTVKLVTSNFPEKSLYNSLLANTPLKEN